MSPVLITPAAADVVGLTELKSMLSIDGAEQDAVLPALAAAVVGQIDPAAGGWLGRALRPATWETRLRHFPCGRIDLPYPPCAAIVSVQYDDANGVEQTLVENVDYRVFLRPFDRSFIAPVWNGAWPSTRGDVESVRIRFTAGYPAAPTDTMPQPIKAAVALGVRKLMPLIGRDLTLSSEETPGVERLSYVVSETAGKVLEDAVANLLSIYRVWG